MITILKAMVVWAWAGMGIFAFCVFVEAVIMWDWPDEYFIARFNGFLFGLGFAVAFVVRERGRDRRRGFRN